MRRGRMAKTSHAFVATMLLFGVISTAAEKASAATFAGVRVTAGSTVRVDVPLSDLERSYVSEGGNVPPARAVAVLAVPPAFDPVKTWPVLVVFSTSDFKRQNRDDLVNFYREAGLAQGWVLIAGDGPEPARHDSSGWSAGMTLAVLDAMHRSFPGSDKWPIACAGFSGGAKRAGLLAPLLLLAGNRVIGVFLTGVNEDTLSDGFRTYKPGGNFLRTPVFLSTGAADKIAQPQQQNEVKLSMQKTGFGRVRQETFPTGHVVKRTHIEEALRWFRESQGAG